MDYVYNIHVASSQSISLINENLPQYLLQDHEFLTQEEQDILFD